MKKAIGLALALTMLLPTSAFAAGDGGVYINGDKVDVGETVEIEWKTWTEAEPFLKALGAEFEIEDGTVTAEKDGVTAEEVLKEIDGKEFLPLRATVEDLGGSVYWEAATRNINVKLALTDEGVLNKHYYRISTGGKSLDIADGGLVLSDQSDSDSQQWLLTKKSDGYYTWTNKSNGNSPDVPNGSTDAGKALIQYSANNNDNQHFGLVKNDDGTWNVTVKHSKLYLTATDGGITQEEASGDDTQKFTFTYLGSPEKTVRTVDNSNKKKEKTPIDESRYYSAEGLGDWVTITKKTDNLVDVEGDRTYQNVMLSWNGESYDLLNPKTGEIVASYDFEESGEREAEKYEEAPLHKSYVTIEKNGKFLTVTDDGLLFTAESGDSSQWLLLAKGNDYYSVTNKATEKSIDVPGVSMNAGTALITYTAGTGDNQRFKLTENADGTYLITAKHSGYWLSESDGKLIQGERGDGFTLTERGKGDPMTMGATAMPFLLDGEDYLTNMKVQWNDVDVDRYDVYRSENGGEYKLIASVEGLCVDDYDLKLGASYTYRIDAISGDCLIDSATTEAAETYQVPDIEFNEFSNIKLSGLSRPNTLTDGTTYFKFSQKSRTDGGSGFGQLMLSTSTDDVVYSEEVEVLNFDDILASNSTGDIDYCGFESIHYVYNPETEMLYMWAHMEANGGYSYARVAVAYGKPGERFSFDCFRPMGDDSRDMGIYVDDDNSAYIICAIHGNADLAIYKLTEDWTDVEKQSCIVNYGRYRELPSVLKKDGIYYLFHSGTAGWYPTQGGYNVATNIEGPWSELRTIGNTNTFSSQSGGVSHLTEGGDDALMLSYRWMWWWQDATNRSTQNRLMPITVSNGFAFFDYYDNFYYDIDEDILIPVQTGRILSDGKPITATDNNEYAHDANDANYNTEWVSEEDFPAAVTINLEQVYTLSEMQISWRSYNGRETYYNYTVETSIDGETWTEILDRSEGYTDYAFTVDTLSGQAQYVRINILDNTPRSGEKTAYTPNMYEIRILGY